MRGTNNSSAGNKYEPELVDFPGLLPSHCSTQAQFSRRTEVPRFFAWCFSISLPDVSRFLRLMFPDFLPNASWFLYLMYPDCLMFPGFFFWCIPISWPDVSRFPCFIFTNVFAEYQSFFSLWTLKFLVLVLFTIQTVSQRFSPQNKFLPSFLYFYSFIWNFEQITVPQCWLCCWVTTLCRRRGGLLGKIWSSVTISYERHNVVTRYDNLRKGNVVTAMSSCAELTGQLQPSGDPATVASCWQTILVCQNISTDWNQTISCLTLHHLVSTWSTWYAGRGDGHSKQTLNPRPWDNGGGGLNWFPLLVYLCIWVPWNRAE